MANVSAPAQEIKNIIKNPIVGGLDGTYEHAETPAGLKTELYTHQKVILAALLRLEDTRMFVHQNCLIKSQALLLSEPFGTGKTFEILALILARPVPRAMPMHININNKYANSEIQVTAKFTGNAFLKPNLIVVGGSVFKQWENTIAKYTNLRVLAVDNFYKLRNFDEIFQQDSINDYDIVLVKCGTVVAKVIGKPNTPPVNLIHAIGLRTFYHCWSRVIYDDFDAIEQKGMTFIFNALFSIYVSATKRVVKKQTTDNRRIMNTRMSDIVNDDTLYGYFNVYNNQAFVTASNTTPVINFYNYVVKNPNKQIIDALIHFRGSDPTIIEMFNSDALETAAENYGIKAQSYADLFSKLLDNEYAAYIKANNAVDVLREVFKRPYDYTFDDLDDEVIELISSEDVDKKNNDATRSASHNEVNEPGRKKLSAEQLACFTSEEIRAEVKHALIVNLQRVKRLNAGITRLKENIAEGDCQVCHNELKDTENFIIKCCGAVLCKKCFGSCNLVHDKNKQNIIGRCVTCLKQIKVSEDVIMINKEFKIEEIIKSNGTESGLIAPIKKEVAAAADDEVTKFTILNKIINGIHIEDKTATVMNIEKLMVGNVDKPLPAGREKKIIIFTSYDESMEKIYNNLRKSGINPIRFKGNVKGMADIIEKFKNTPNTALIINANQNCSGINLQFCTDLILFHKIHDINVQAQVIGRAQRIGREFNLNVHCISYDTEK